MLIRALVRTRRSVVWVALAGAVLAAGCDGCRKNEKKSDSGQVEKKAETKRPALQETRGLAFRLSPGEGMKKREARARVDRGQALATRKVAAILKRLPPMKTRAADRAAFAFRGRSLPPPRAGETIRTPFPPPARPAAPAAAGEGELKVLRASPKGEVSGLAPNLSVTFSRPMVAVTSHAATVAGGVPVKVTPPVKGKWRWIGTRTLLFEPGGRFAMSTKYEAVVQAGAKSARGATLKKAWRWSFSTPAPRVVEFFPRGGKVRRDALVYLRFDQKIDPAAVLKTITLKSEHGGQAPFKRAPAERIAQDEHISRRTRAAIKGRWIVLTPTKKLDPDTRYTATVGPKTPSAEGPLKTAAAQTHTFRTYPPLDVKWQSCDRSKCRPTRQMSVRFTTSLDPESFDEKRIKISPALVGRRVSARGRHLSIGGQTGGRMTYRVTLPGDLRDVYGQTLGRDRELTFDYGSARPRLYGDYRRMRVLDPHGEKVYKVRSINIDKLAVKLYRVQPSDWEAYLAYRRKARRDDAPPPPGKLIVDKTMKPGAAADALVTTRIDLSPALTKGRGQVAVVVHQLPLPAKNHKRQYLVTWIQATGLALDAYADAGQLKAWVTRLADGKAVKGAKISMPGDPVDGVTDAGGMARVALPESRRANRVLAARAGGDVVLLPARRHGTSWMRRPPPGDTVRWYVFDDRKLYKPGEKLRLKGWIRVTDMGPKGGIKLLPRDVRHVTYKVLGPRRNKLAAGKVPINAMGGFDVAAALPDAANLGRAHVALSVTSSARGASHRHRFKIQEFRRPEFEVKASVGAGPHVVGSFAEVQVKASYFAGGPLPNTEVKWRVHGKPASFTPPNQGEFSFVGYRPTWQRGRDPSTRWRSNTQQFQGLTDGRGLHRLRVDLDAVNPPRPVSVSTRATIRDVNRQTWTSNVSLLVHPARHYVGLRTKRMFVKRGKPLKVQAVVSDLSGKLVAGRPIEVVASRIDYRLVKGRFQNEAVEPRTCKVTSGAGPIECSFATKKGGTYLLKATIKDPDGRPNQTLITRWVSGGRSKPARNVKVQQLKLVTDKTTYAPGETAEILVQAPFPGAEGLLTIRRAGIYEQRRFRVKGTSATLRVPLDERHFPGLSVMVDLVGAAARLDGDGKPITSAPLRPALATGSAYLSLPPRSRRLALKVTPARPRLSPGSKTEIVVDVADASGKAVAGAEVAVVVVDEAVLALTGYKLGDPLPVFYPRRYGRVDVIRLRASVSLDEKVAVKQTKARSEEPRAPGQQKLNDLIDGAVGGRDHGLGGLGTLGRGGGGGSGSGYGRAAPSPASRKRDGRGPGARPMAVRRDFRALALFAPAVKTDAGGAARVRLTMPDSLTRYRVMAVAVSGEKYYGQGEGSITTRRPLMVRPSPPRFLNFGDQFELPVVIQNQTDRPLAVEIAVRGTNVELTQGAGRQVTVPASDRLEVRFPSKAVEAGVARFQIGTVAGDFVDAAELKIPVWTPATTEAFATYGTLDRGAAVQPVKMPPGVIPSFGGLQISTSSTALQALTDAVLYLVSYRYECAEQLSSRILAVAALRDVLSAFKAPGLPPPAAILAAVKRDLKRLQGLQNPGGGFGFWRRGQRSWPFVTNHVAHALVRAKLKGLSVPDGMYRRALVRLRKIESIIPSWYSKSSRRAIVAYSLYVRALAGDRDTPRAGRLLEELLRQKNPSMEAVGWLYPVLQKDPRAAKIRKLLINRVSEEAATAHFVTSYTDGAHVLLHSARRVDAILLEGLIADQPKSDLIPKLVRGLLDHRKRGRWSNTQENAWVLLALDRYFNTYEKVTPNFVARAWLGPRFAGQHAYRGRSAKRQEIEIPMSVLASAKSSVDLTLSKKGPGRLYYRIGMRYAPSDLKPPPASHGFTVRRSYEAVDDPGDLRREADGTWRVKAGARVRVRLRMVAPGRRYHVALVDPLPAGLEPINVALKGAEGATPAGRRGIGRSFGGRLGGLGGLGRRGRLGRYRGYRGWRGRWYEHQNLRDERAEAFGSLVHSGVHSFTYLARATTPGVFVVPPPKAEEMYHPETFGRGPGDKLIVE